MGKKEVILKESKKAYLVGFGGREGGNDVIILYSQKIKEIILNQTF